MIKDAAKSGADVAHFPECAISGYGPAEWPDWSSFDWAGLARAKAQIASYAKSFEIWVVAGSALEGRSDKKPNNSLLVFDRRGQIQAQYDKQHCSDKDLQAFDAGTTNLIIDIEGVKCGLLICLDWASPSLWKAYAGKIELVFHSAVSTASRTQSNAFHTIPAVMQAYAWHHQFAISASNASQPHQGFASFWVERSGHLGKSATKDQPGFVINSLINSLEQDRFFKMVADSRKRLGKS